MSSYPVYFGPQIAGGVRGKEVEHDTEAPGTPGQHQTGHVCRLMGSRVWWLYPYFLYDIVAGQNRRV